MSRAERGLLLLALVWLWLLALSPRAEAVVPVVVGPLQALLAILPSLLLALGAALLALFRPSGVKKLARFLWHQKVFSTVLLAVVAGIVFAARYDWGQAGPAAAEMRAGADWPAFRGGPLRRGAVLGLPEPTRPEPVWNFRRDVRTVFASPAVVGNRIYVTSADKGVFSDIGAILCIDAETGAEVWRYSPGGFRATFSSPAVKDGYVVCGEGLHYTTDSRITCLDLSGNRLWELRTKSHVESSPCIYNGRVYVGAGDDGYYCVELRPGPDGQPRVVWHLAGERYQDCECSPTAADGVVYFGLGQGGNAICAVNAETGRELWRIEAPYPVFGPPTLVDGKLYIGMGNGNFIETAEQVRARVLAEMREGGESAEEIAAAEKRLEPVGEVWCVDLKTRKVEWKYKVRRTILGAIAAGRDRLYFGSRDGRLYCLSTKGKLVGRWNAHDPIMASPALGSEHVYFVTQSGRLHCLAANALEPVWDVQLGDGENFVGSPTLALGHIYVGTAEDGLACIGRVGEPPVPLWTDGARGGADRSPLPARGALAWRYPKTSSAPLTVTAPMMMLDGALYVPCSLADHAGLMKLKLGRGIKDDAERIIWTRPLPEPVTIPPAGVGKHVYVVAGSPGKTDLALYCLNADDGEERWQLPLQPGASGQFALDRRHLYIWTGPETLTCLPVRTDERPEPLWSKRLGRGAVPPAPGKGILTVATASELLALDDGTGTRLWRARLKDAPIFGPVRLERSVVVAMQQGISLHRIVDGSRVWSAALGRIAAPPVADQDRVAAITEGGELVMLSTSEGKELARVPDASRGVPPLLASEKIVFAGKDLMLSGGATDKPRQWARTGWLGRFLTPLILFDSHVYFATDKRGVVCLSRR